MIMKPSDLKSKKKLCGPQTQNASQSFFAIKVMTQKQDIVSFSLNIGFQSTN